MHPGEHTPDAVRLLSRALARAARLGDPATGTDHLLFVMLQGGTPTARALAPSASGAGKLMGTIVGTSPHWVSRDDEAAPPDAEADAFVTATLREAHWSTRHRGRIRGALPPPTPSLLACLRGALVHAGTDPVTPAHLLLGLLDLRASRADEALRLRQVDRDVVVAAAARAREEPTEQPAVALLRKAGVFGDRPGLFTRWLSSGYGSPVLPAVTVEAERQAVRRGAAEVEPVDLLLGVLSLERLVADTGRRLPGGAADVLRAHGVDLPGLVSAVRVPPVPLGDSVPVSAEARRTLSAARLRVADGGRVSVDAEDLLVALLDGPVGPLLADAGHDVPALRAALAVVRR
jgi:hypothetical protein